jgi:hypothetical protein
MSIATMTRMASQAEAARKQPAGGQPGKAGPRAAGGAAAGGAAAGGAAAGGAAAGAGGTPPAVGGATVTSSSDPQSRAQASLEAIAAWIPSEALALYIAALGAFNPTTQTAGFVVLALGLGFVILFVAFSALDRKTRPPMDKTIIVAGIGLVSFTVYAAALPSSPFEAVFPQASVVAAFVALVMASILPRVAGLLGVAPADA